MSTRSAKAEKLIGVKHPSNNQVVTLQAECHQANVYSGAMQRLTYEHDDCQGISTRKEDREFCFLLKTLKDKTVIRQNKERYIVYFDDSLNLRWEFHADVKDRVNAYACMMEIEHIAALPIDYLSKKHLMAWGKMLAHAISLATMHKVEDAAKVAKSAKRFINARAREKARFWWVQASIACSFLLFVIYAITLFNFLKAIDLGGIKYDEILHNELFLIATAIIFGVIGSQFSILERLGSIEVDPSAGRVVYWVDAVVRILTGAFAAVVSYAALKSDIILGFLNTESVTSLNNKYFWIVAFISMLSGFSERFVPSLLRKAEEENGNTKPEGDSKSKEQHKPSSQDEMPYLEQKDKTMESTSSADEG
ncbi:hypothetical protein SAMN05660964_01138 [Thiothrix caldifontis]|uniref:Uncharacterized protein n=1 Tax=Thiothrix caldifontis TaxID=525918 RepID=A0A1H3ZDF0_9GAMM|nr:hypothetical protein [Thiothrix caldifontis]SEA21645.1 hypothetical protein SAMN05660964_01138 [Thiothrix caldifontis]